MSAAAEEPECFNLHRQITGNAGLPCRKRWSFPRRQKAAPRIAPSLESEFWNEFPFAAVRHAACKPSTVGFEPEERMSRAGVPENRADEARATCWDGAGWQKSREEQWLSPHANAASAPAGEPRWSALVFQDGLTYERCPSGAHQRDPCSLASHSCSRRMLRRLERHITSKASPRSGTAPRVPSSTTLASMRAMTCPGAPSWR